jgi:c(7)-type cytochrome triheme protein
MKARIVGFLFPLLVLAALVTIAMGSPQTKHKILSTIFDGVGKPRPATPAKSKKNTGCVTGPAAAETVLVEGPRPEIEKLKSWEEVLEVLPKDMIGGPDWVKAVKDAVIAPRPRMPWDVTPAAPFTFDTLVPSIVSEKAPALDADIEIVPEKAPFYKVVFPHSSHTLWLNCSSCHPGRMGQRGSGMPKIFAGEYCGKCHGKVSFSPLTSCGRCHANLVPAAREIIEADLANAAQSPLAASPELVELGKKLYLEDCAVCHGEKGDGSGPSAEDLDPRPRDFTAAKFKFRSTPSSSLPTDFDIFRTITRGVPGTSMPSFSFVSYRDRFALLQFIKTFSDRFARRKPEAPIPIPEPPPRTAEILRLGRELYMKVECNKCHGDTGKGDGPSAATTKDDWEQPLRPANLTADMPKSGTSLKDYYRTMMTGLKGTPMPDSSEVFEPDQAWAVVYYVYSLGEKSRNAPPAVKGDILFTRRVTAKIGGPAAAGPNAPVPTPPAGAPAAPAAVPPAAPGAQPGAAPQPAGAGVPPASAHPAGPVPMTDENAPPSTFAHWFHRMRVRCSACHPGVFEMKAGANNITMDDIRSGKFCGKCHPSYPDPKALVAWPVSFDSCSRCHVAQ